MEAVQNCEKLAYEYGNQQIDEQHLLYSLLTLEDSLILKLITKMGIQGDMLSLIHILQEHYTGLCTEIGPVRA